MTVAAVCGMTAGAWHRLQVRRKPQFLHRLMVELAGDARISLEGDLRRCQLADDLVVGRDETTVLKRSTLAPKQDFVILRLTPETVTPIYEQVMQAGLSRAIIHVQIERRGVLELGAYDNFHPDCVVTGPGVVEALLNELKDNNVLRDFKVASSRD